VEGEMKGERKAPSTRKSLYSSAFQGSGGRMEAFLKNSCMGRDFLDKFSPLKKTQSTPTQNAVTFMSKR
jgi:hypothetical protein